MMASLIEHGIRSPAVLHAMAGVPREEFVLEADRERAYADRALPIDASGQTISQPLMVAAVVEALELHTGDRALDVGTGSGYQAAVMAACGAHVVSIERVSSLARTAAPSAGPCVRAAWSSRYSSSASMNSPMHCARCCTTATWC